MLIIALVLAVIGLAALVTAVVTSNELVAWVCIGASVLGVVLLIVDALRERSRGAADNSGDETPAATEDAVQDYPDEPTEAEPADEPEPADETEPAGETEPADEGDEHDAEPAADEAAEEHKN